METNDDNLEKTDTHDVIYDASRQELTQTGCQILLDSMYHD